MKKVLAASLAAVMVLSAVAEGYQVNSFSARQQGMGMTGVSQVLGAESLIFNPAAVALMPGSMDLSASLSGIASTANCWYNGVKYTTSSKVSTPFNLSAAFRINDSMAAGLSIYTPYGSGINWGINWPGAALNQSVELKVFSIQPTFSWRITDKLSIGAGLSIAWGKVDLNKGLVSPGSLNALGSLMVATGQLPGYEPYNGVTPASVNIVGTSKMSYGVNVGALYEFSKNFSVGVSYRSKLDMHVEAGDVEVKYANTQANLILGETLNNMNSTNFDASMPCPYVLTVGFSYKPNERWLLAFDAQLNGWGTYKNLDISFAQQEQFNQHLVKDYHNAMTYHAGAEFQATPRLKARAGVMIDTSPCNTDHYNPETPGATKIEPGLGISFSPVDRLSIDLSLMYVYGTKIKDAVGQYDDFLAKKYNAALQTPVPVPGTEMTVPLGTAMNLQPLPLTGEFRADYQVHAFIPAVGISYSF